jgi:hypothetical protein
MTRNTRGATPVLVALTAAAIVLFSQTGTTIGGHILDADTRTPLAGMAIVAARVPDATVKLPIDTLTRSSSDGSFSLKVTPGIHRLCVEGGKIYLDPCLWSPGTATLDTSKGSTIDLLVKRGVLLVVQLHDPGRNVAVARAANPALARVPAPPIAVKISNASGANWAVPFLRAEGTAFSFSLLAPPKSAFTLKVSSSALALSDKAGNPLPGNSRETAIVTPDLKDPPQKFLGRIVGPPVPSQVHSFVVKGLIGR